MQVFPGFLRVFELQLGKFSLGFLECSSCSWASFPRVSQSFRAAAGQVFLGFLRVSELQLGKFSPGFSEFPSCSWASFPWVSQSIRAAAGQVFLGFPIAFNYRG